MITLKRKLFVLITVFCLFGSLFIHADVKYGDINNNGEVNTADLISLAKYLSGRIGIDSIDAEAADCYYDSRVNSDDLLTFLKYLTGAVKELPVGKPAETTSASTTTTAITITSTKAVTTTTETVTTTTTKAVTTTTTKAITTTTTEAITTTTTKAVTTTTSPEDKSYYAKQVIILVNEERAKLGLTPLKGAERLDKAADIRAEEVSVLFSHTRPDGSSCFTVLAETGINYYSSAAENIAQGQKTPSEVINSWMNSDGHRANILNPDLTHIGVGFVNNSWVQLFVEATLTDEYLPQPIATTSSVTTTITSSATTTTVTVTTTTVPVTTTVPQVDLYRYIYGSWFEAALQVIDERAGLTLDKDITVPISIESIQGTVLAEASGAFSSASLPANKFNIRFNNYYVQYDTIIPNIDGLMPSFSNVMPMDTVFAHELTHGLCYMNITYSTLSSIPDWYFEGICEAVAGNNRLYDYPPGSTYSLTWNGKTYSRVQTWVIAHDMIDAISEDTTDASIYYVGYLLCNWLDNYGSYAGEFTAENGGRIKDLNVALMKGQTFSNACKNTFGKTSAALLAEFKTASAAIDNYNDWVNWLDSDMNIQCDDGQQDALCNSDALQTDIIPNLGEPKDISDNDTIEYDGVYITFKWIFD